MCLFIYVTGCPSFKVLRLREIFIALQFLLLLPLPCLQIFVLMPYHHRRRNGGGNHVGRGEISSSPVVRRPRKINGHLAWGCHVISYSVCFQWKQAPWMWRVLRKVQTTRTQARTLLATRKEPELHLQGIVQHHRAPSYSTVARRGTYFHKLRGAISIREYITGSWLYHVVQTLPPCSIVNSVIRPHNPSYLCLRNFNNETGHIVK